MLTVFNNNNLNLNIELYNKNWKLILLGRPIGKSGLQITQWCDTINLNYPQKKIFYETEYISKENFDKQLVDSNFIICPISSEHYKKGKDSGALYDILCFNKLGIIHEDYFYDENLLEKKVMFTYKDNEELKIMITNIINKTVSFSAINDQIKLFNEVFNEANYLQSIRYQLWKLIKE